jgi:hypothetical protein
MKRSLRALLFATGLSLVGSVSAALFDREVVFSETEIQNSLLKNGPQSQNYGGWMTVSLREAPKSHTGQSGRPGRHRRPPLHRPAWRHSDSG